MIACKEVYLQSEDSLYDRGQFNEVSLEKLFNEEYVNLCSYFEYKFQFSHDEAKDAVHEGFVRLWERREMLSSYSSVKMYLFKIIGNICLDLLKRRNVRGKHEKHLIESTSSINIESPLEQLNAKQLIKDIEHSVANMPEQMRMVFKLSRYEGLKYAEIAARLNISVKTVETQMSRALERLRNHLSNYLKVSSVVFLLNFSLFP